MDFVEQLKSSADIVSVVGDYVRLRKSGASRYTGLCPFHSEKTPSFSVHASKQFYHCFGCQAHGDVLKFVMEIEGLSFYEALKSLAERYGIPMPKRSQYADEDSRKRERPSADARTGAGEFSRQPPRAGRRSGARLPGAAGRIAGNHRAVRPGILRPIRPRPAAPVRATAEFTPEHMEQSGLVGKREDGSFYDRFRNRLMFPIHNETGKIIAYGGRALAAEDEPKYLNSPETPIYKKSHVLYNLHRAKEAIRKEDRVILVEGYMDVIGVTAAGFAAGGGELRDRADRATGAIAQAPYATRSW